MQRGNDVRVFKIEEGEVAIHLEVFNWRQNIILLYRLFRSQRQTNTIPAISLPPTSQAHAFYFRLLFSCDYSSVLRTVTFQQNGVL